MGIISPLLLEGKLLIRKLCQQKLAWDEKLSPELASDWADYARKFNELATKSDLSFPRQLVNSDEPSSFLIFTDASKLAYGFVIYTVQGSRSNLFFSKYKLAPKPDKSLPSLELLAIYLALCCMSSIISNKNFHSQVMSITILTDSQVALSWVLSNKVRKNNVFVSNRLKDIVSFKDNLMAKGIDVVYSYVPTAHNIADILTKPISLKKMESLFNYWIQGPPWSSLPRGEWPRGQLGCIPVSFHSSLETSHSNLLMSVVKNEEASESGIVNFNKYSSYNKLLNVTMKVFLAIYKFQNKECDMNVIKKRSFVTLFRTMQKECFEKEIDFLSRKPIKYDLAPQLVKNLDLFMDTDGLIRSRGRVSKSCELTYDAINPILVDGHHPLTRLILQDSHLACMHLGVAATLNHARQMGFWVTKARQAVKKVIHSCIICSRYISRPFKMPPSPALPAARVSLSKPFIHTGIDYTGHFFVKDMNGNQIKSYILLFTCMCTRAIHLELVFSLNVEDFVMAFVRFSNRFGLPKVVYTDNARTFSAGCSLLSNLITCDYFKQQFSKYDLSHKTIPVYSPWMGSCWERLIKTTKQALYKAIGRNIISFVNFITLLSDIQIAINNRPLTYSEKDNQLDIITPNKLISLHSHFSSLIISDSQVAEVEDVRETLIASLDLRDVMLSRFRSQWFSNYLLCLREHHRDSFRTEELSWSKNKYLCVGSVVLIQHPVKPRPYWSIGRIVEILPGDDNLVRVVKVKKPDKSVLVTAIKNLYPLELDSSFLNEKDARLGEAENIVSSKPSDEEIEYDCQETLLSNDPEPIINSNELSATDRELVPNNGNDSNCSIRPSRKAAIKFKTKMKQWLEEDTI